MPGASDHAPRRPATRRWRGVGVCLLLLSLATPACPIAYEFGPAENPVVLENRSGERVTFERLNSRGNAVRTEVIVDTMILESTIDQEGGCLDMATRGFRLSGPDGDVWVETFYDERPVCNGDRGIIGPDGTFRWE